MRKSVSRVLTAALAAAAALSAAHAAAPVPREELDRRAAVIRPSAEEVRWRRIPWLGSLVEAARMAREEGRPIFLWVTSDPPLDRC